MDFKKNAYKIFVILAIVSLILSFISLYLWLFSNGNIMDTLFSFASVLIFAAIARYMKAKY
jgi:hypothetical protein